MKRKSFREIMNTIGGFIIKFRLPIIVIVVLLVGFCAYGITRTNINSDIMSYLPEGTDTYDGSEFLSKNFGIESNAVYAVKGESVSYEDLALAVEKSKEDEQVTDIMWLGSMASAASRHTCVVAELSR